MPPARPVALTFDGPVVVTGATGFVGGALVRGLAASWPRAPVRALVRSRGPLALPPTVESFPGDLADESALAAALRGARAVVHAAAVSSERDRAEIFRVNVEGTRRLIDAARRAGVERLVAISSAAVYGSSGDGAPLDEDAPRNARGAYGTSKLAAEREAVRFGERAGARLTILRPSGLYGRGRALYAELMSSLRRRPWRLALPGDQLVQPCHVDDLVSAILCSLADAEPGTRVFNVAGPEALPLEELYDRIARLAGIRSRRFRLPRALAIPAVALYRLRGGLEPATVASMRARARGETVGIRLDTRRIERRYGVVWTPLESGLREMVEAFVAAPEGR